MIVLDGSALVIAVTDTTERSATIRARIATVPTPGPELIDAEVGQALRALVMRGQLTAAQARRRLGLAVALVTERYPHRPLLSRAWELRDNVSFYDGLYVALAEALGTPLLTADTKLAAATGPRCPFELA